MIKEQGVWKDNISQKWTDMNSHIMGLDKLVYEPISVRVASVTEWINNSKIMIISQKEYELKLQEIDDLHKTLLDLKIKATRNDFKKQLYIYNFIYRNILTESISQYPELVNIYTQPINELKVKCETCELNDIVGIQKEVQTLTDKINVY